MNRFTLCGIVLLLAAIVGQVQPSSAQGTNYYNSAGYWLPKCRAPVGSADLSECLGFFTGWEAAIKLMGGSSAFKGGLNYCPPPTTTFAQAINIVVSYSNRYPGQTHLDFGVFVAGALNEAFPCGRR